jgi:hypothetical protein
MAEDGDEILRMEGPTWWDWQRDSDLYGLSVDPRDGSVWVVGAYGECVHLSEDGVELSRFEGILGVWSFSVVSVNPRDGSVWLADSIGGAVVHIGRPGLMRDVPLDHWANDEVEACVNAGIVTGYDDGSYRPSLAVTRDQMAVYIARALAGGDASVPSGPASATFFDVPPSHWAYDHIEYVVALDVVEGYSRNRYMPNGVVDRAQMAVYIARSIATPTGEAGLVGYVPSAPRNFPDVPPAHWAYLHVEYCSENGVVEGCEDGLYHPESAVTRDQLAVYVARAFGLVE